MIQLRIDQFFDSFTSFQLFREPYFRATLYRIPTATQIKALLAAMLAFAVKERSANNNDHASSRNDGVSRDEGSELSSHFSLLAMKYVDHAVSECQDDPLSLPLLQALILITHWLLIQGVRGRAWRYLGLCIRSAYELNLHLIDLGRGLEDNLSDPAQWCEDEERRRAWWAIWEMDVFASVIRRCPTAIDWSQNESFLPAEDDKWFRGEPQQSCILETSLVSRWKALEASGNQSPKAWFIVINSLMKEAQKISSPIGIDRALSLKPQLTARNTNSNHEGRRRPDAGPTKDAINRLYTVHNSLRCAVMALPRGLKYESQFLGFGAGDMIRDGTSSRRLQYSSVYSIHLMTQLTKLMIYKYYIFRTGLIWPHLAADPGRLRGQLDENNYLQKPSSGVLPTVTETQALEQYFDAADETAGIIRRCFENHYKYVNPFLSNIIWLAAAVQLLHRELYPASSSDKDLINSNFELLCMTYNQFVNYWNMSTTLQKNLHTLETEFQALQNDADEQQHGERYADETLNALHRDGAWNPPISRTDQARADSSRQDAARARSEKSPPHPHPPPPASEWTVGPYQEERQTTNMAIS